MSELGAINQKHMLTHVHTQGTPIFIDDAIASRHASVFNRIRSLVNNINPNPEPIYTFHNYNSVLITELLPYSRLTIL